MHVMHMCNYSGHDEITTTSDDERQRLLILRINKLIGASLKRVQTGFDTSPRSG